MVVAHPRKLLHRTVKALFRSLGYELVWHRRQESSGGARYVVEFPVTAVFDYFYAWETRFHIDGHPYGGSTDYTSARVSLLNIAELYDHTDFRGKSVLELGPLEGGNTLMLSRLGARRITAIEGRVENYVKCCVVKNLFGLENVTFALDDVRNVSLDAYGRFDIALVAGVLYHLDNPHILIERLSVIADNLVISTHYADAASPSPNAEVLTLKTKFGTYRGRSFREGGLHEINSGLQTTSFWPFEEDLTRMLRDVGYKNLTVIKSPLLEGDPYSLIYLVAKR